MPTGEIHLSYFLSPAGQAAALAAGVNAGELQTIILRAPDYEEPAAPVDALKAVLDAATATSEAATGEAASPALADVAKVLVTSIAALAVALDPSSTRNVTVEQADADLWALAVSMAGMTRNGEAILTLRHDERPSWISNYHVVWDEHKYQAVVTPNTEWGGFDAIQTAATALPAERDRRAALKESETAAWEEARTLAEKKTQERLADARTTAVSSAVFFLERESAWADLPAVAALRALVDANDVDAIYAGGDWNKRPAEAARKAIEAAKAKAQFDEKAAWVREYGSPHAQRLLAEMGTVDDTMYRAERLAAERPGWKYGSTSYYSSMPTPSLDDLDRLQAAKAVEPEATLQVIRVGNKDVLRPVAHFQGQSIYDARPSPAELREKAATAAAQA